MQLRRYRDAASATSTRRATALARCGRTGRRSPTSPGEMGPEELTKAQARVDRQLRQNGVTYNVHAAESPARPWALDVLPHIVTADEWAPLEPRPAPARPPARSGRQRYLRRSAAADGGGLLPPALVLPDIPASSACATGSRRPAACACTWSRSTWRAGRDGDWRVLGDPDAGAIGRRLRAREPADDLAAVPRRVS